jgi:hypothetical protein
MKYPTIWAPEEAVSWTSGKAPLKRPHHEEDNMSTVMGATGYPGKNITEALLKASE